MLGAPQPRTILTCIYFWKMFDFDVLFSVSQMVEPRIKTMKLGDSNVEVYTLAMEKLRDVKVLLESVVSTVRCGTGLVDRELVVDMGRPICSIRTAFMFRYWFQAPFLLVLGTFYKVPEPDFLFLFLFFFFSVSVSFLFFLFSSSYFSFPKFVLS